MASTTYATVDELRARAGLGEDQADDPLLQSLLDTAAAIVDKATRGRIEGTEAFAASSSVARTFNDRLSDVLHPIDDLLTVSAVTRNGVSVSSSDYLLHPLNRGNGPATHIEFSQYVISTGGTGNFYSHGVGHGQISITGTWGYCTQANRPAVIKEATIKLAQKLYYETHAKQQDLMNAVQDPSRMIDRHIDALLRPYRKGRHTLA